ncbi:TadE/TadG family type IV pilus assembly protein [Hyphobacterium sp. HN65]|uniref:TadE/TadG family type IV pilus assembly protein n=1 Tax=Hyphobacterium lacteum TaxID=3116575 RepID=A0ABU7LNP3_9PROT|nr:TadE/TadG family type IV pilus assembly protein [Hyphobacterium sp. HN65]MEE2525517.1 TadE/TadG family type IV pilus assembly protein [Hyphobacterium sp. HN65]
MRKPGFFRSFRKNRDGATAVEFALVAGPFLFFLMALIEIAAMFFAETVIDNAVLESARLIRTGQLQNGGGGATAFREEVCDRIVVIADCDRMAFEVAVFQDFDTVAPTDPLNQDGTMNEANMGFDPGRSGDIVLVRVYYRWQVLMPQLFGGRMGNMADGQRLIVSSTVFRNEPYDD